MEHKNVITKNEFEEMVKMHNKWLKGDGGRRADFSWAKFEPGVSINGIDLRFADFRNSDLSGMDLSNANFSHADMSNADLSNSTMFDAWLDDVKLVGADLTNTDLRSASMVMSKLVRAKLTGANLRSADLCHSSMCGADMKEADLSYSRLKFADLTNTDLRNADLTNAELGFANLLGSDMSGADLKGADLTRADICGCRFDETETSRMGTVLESPITGYKKSKEGRIVTLEIPEGAVVFSINNRKCRTNVAKVIDTEGEAELTSSYDNGFKYRVGEELKAKDFCMAYNIECTSGIHFFRTREEAEKYNLLAKR